MRVIAKQIPHHGRAVNGNLYLPDGDGKFPVILMGHGYNGNKMDFDLSARFFADNGIASFLYDFCGGSTRDESVFETTQMTIFTEKDDLNAVLDAVISLDEADSDNIFLFGGSQGGLISALTADERTDDVRGLILLYPALCIADNWNERFPDVNDIPEEEELWGMKLGRVFFESIHGYDVFEHIGKFDRNVLVMHGDKDIIVAQCYSERAQSLYKNAELHVFEGEGHGFSEEGNKKMTEMTLDFIKKNVV